jgi:hypothetical protein
MSKEFRISKAGDLMWRLLYYRVVTGSKLIWLSVGSQKCLIHEVDFTIEYIWIGYTVAKAV